MINFLKGRTNHSQPLAIFPRNKGKTWKLTFSSCNHSHSGDPQPNRPNYSFSENWKSSFKRNSTSTSDKTVETLWNENFDLENHLPQQIFHPLPLINVALPPKFP